LEFRDISRVSEAITATGKRMKMDPYYQRRNCSPLNALFSDVKIALISQGSPQLGGVKQRWDHHWDGKTSPYTHTAVARLPGVSYAFLYITLYDKLCNCFGAHCES